MSGAGPRHLVVGRLRKPHGLKGDCSVFPLTADAAANSASRRRKMLIAGNLFMWLFEGAYIVSPIDLITDVLPIIAISKSCTSAAPFIAMPLM